MAKEVKVVKVTDTREFSYWVIPHDVPSGGKSLKISADNAACVSLAARFELEALSSLTAQLRLRPTSGGRNVIVSGQFSAHITRKCSITLNSFDQEIKENIEAEYGPVEEEMDLELSLSDADPVEPFEAQGIDLGELVAQHLALALDPFPRAPGVSLEDVRQNGTGGAEVVSLNQPSGPFAALAALKEVRKP